MSWKTVSKKGDSGDGSGGRIHAHPRDRDEAAGNPAASTFYGIISVPGRRMCATARTVPAITK